MGKGTAIPPVILVVEDNAAIRESLTDLLQCVGFQVEAVANGREALTALAFQNFSLVLLDLMMPVMNGWEFLREVRRRGAKVPVIVITAGRESEDELEANGSQAYFVKPFDPEELFAAINRLAA